MNKLTKFEVDVSNISALSDYPNANDGMTSMRLKETYDKAGNDIKDFINNTLTEEIDSKIEEVTNNVDTNFATKDELRDLQLGQLIDGTVSLEKLTEDTQEKINKVDGVEKKVEPICKYHKLAKPIITKENGKYINNFWLDILPENLTEGLIFNVEFPVADEKQNGTDYYTVSGYKVSCNKAKNYEEGIDRAFDKNEETNCVLTASDTILITLPSAKTFTKIKTFITADNLSNIIYKGSNDKETWTNLTVVSSADTELTEHEFTLTGEYLYYGIEINITDGTAIINEIQFEEDENFPSEWLLGTDSGMLTVDVLENRINNLVIDGDIEAGEKYDYYIENNKCVSIVKPCVSIVKSLETREKLIGVYNRCESERIKDVSDTISSLNINGCNASITNGKYTASTTYSHNKTFNNITHSINGGSYKLTTESSNTGYTSLQDLGDMDGAGCTLYVGCNSSNKSTYYDLTFEWNFFTPRTVNSMNFRIKGYCNYYIRVSEDGINFTTVKSGSTSTTSAYTDVKGTFDSEKKYVAIRLVISAKSGGVYDYAKVYIANFLMTISDYETVYTNKFSLDYEIPKLRNNEIVCLETCENVVTTYVTSNTLNGIQIDTILQPNTKYELLYKEANNKFYVKEVVTL